MSDQYYVRRAGKISGPARAKLLEQYAANGKLQVTDEVATSPNGPWHAVSKVPLLANHLPATDELADPFGDPLAAASLMADGASVPPTSRPAKPQGRPSGKPSGGRAQRPGWLVPLLAGSGVVVVLLVAGAGFLLWRGLMDGQTNVLPATPNNPQTQVDEPPAQVVDVDPVAELENLGGTITRNDNGEVVTVRLRMVRRNGPQVTDLVTDAGLVHLKGMTKLQKLFLVSKKKITDARLVHLKEMANLQTLVLRETKATDASVAELQKTVPNCEITK